MTSKEMLATACAGLLLYFSCFNEMAEAAKARSAKSIVLQESRTVRICTVSTDASGARALGCRNQSRASHC